MAHTSLSILVIAVVVVVVFCIVSTGLMLDGRAWRIRSARRRSVGRKSIALVLFLGGGHRPVTESTAGLALASSSVEDSSVYLPVGLRKEILWRKTMMVQRERSGSDGHRS